MISTPSEFHRCLTYLKSQTKAGANSSGDLTELPRPSVTVSRQAGAGGELFAEKLSAYLRARTDGACWTVFDRNLVETVLKDHSLPERLARFMPERWISQIEGTLDELFGLHPPSWILVRQTAETILRLAKLGRVILVGRGATVITAKMDHVLHVRLVAPVERRIERIQQAKGLDRKAALKFIQKTEQGRKLYLRKYYGKDVTDPLLYHLVINTDAMGFDQAAALIGECVLRRWGKQAEAANDVLAPAA